MSNAARDAVLLALRDRFPELAERTRVTGDAGRLADRSGGLPVGDSLLVSLRSGDDVPALVRIAREHGLPVVPRGGGSGLSGGAIPLGPSLVLDFFGLKRIHSIDPAARTAEVEPGITVAELNAALAPHGMFYPPDPASHELASLGGTVATNAGGFRCVKYGVTRAWVRTLEVVLADGSVERIGHHTSKDVTGLDLLSLFVGSEGSLGLITRIGVTFLPIPAEQRTIVAMLPTIVAAGAAIQRVRDRVVPSMLELVDRGALVSRDTSALRPLLPWDPQAPGDDSLVIAQFDGLAAGAEAEIALAEFAAGGARVAEVPPAQLQALLDMRRGAHSSREPRGEEAPVQETLVAPTDAVYAKGQDVVVPISRVVELIVALREIAERAGLDTRTIAHAGDGNLHPLFVIDHDRATEAEASRRLDGAMEELIAVTLELGGAVTGEHGIGCQKRAWAARDLGPGLIRAQERIKAALDPEGLFNPGKAF